MKEKDVNAGSAKQIKENGGKNLKIQLDSTQLPVATAQGGNGVQRRYIKKNGKQQAEPTRVPSEED